MPRGGARVSSEGGDERRCLFVSRPGVALDWVETRSSWQGVELEVRESEAEFVSVKVRGLSHLFGRHAEDGGT